MTKIKIPYTLTNRQLAQRYERVGVYRLNRVDMTMLVGTMVAYFGSFPEVYPGLKAGNWDFEYDRYIEFQAISYTDITGCKMLMMVEGESKEGVTVSLCFSGMVRTPMLVVRDMKTLFLQGTQLLTRMEEIMAKKEPTKPALTRWQRFKNWFRRKPSNNASSSKPTEDSSVLYSIGEVISDIVAD